MLEIKINLTADSIDEFLETVRKFQSSITKEPNVEIEIGKPTKKAAKEVAKEPANHATEVIQSPPLTLEYVRSKVAEKANIGKKIEIRQLLTDFEVSKVTELKSDDYPNFLQKLSDI